MPRIRPEVEVPGLLDAIRRESLLRNLPSQVIESIGPFPVVQMTIPRWEILKLAASPLLYARTPSVEELAQFLWVLNPKWNMQAKGRRRFLRKCAKVFAPPSPPLIRTAWTMNRWTKRHAAQLQRAMELIGAARKYVEDTFADAQMTEPGQSQPSFYSEGVYLCAFLARHLFYTEAEILAMPLRRVFQYYRNIQEWNGVPIGNNSNRLIVDHYCNPRKN